MVWPLSKRLLHFSDKHCCVERLYIFVCLFALLVRIISEYDAYSNKYILFFYRWFYFYQKILKKCAFSWKGCLGGRYNGAYRQQNRENASDKTFSLSGIRCVAWEANK